jgi:cysteine synthase A
MIKPINKITNQLALDNAIKRYREKNIILPTFAQQKNPDSIPQKIKDKLKSIGLWDFHPLNLFRISWKNEPVKSGGLFGKPNYLELSKELTSVDARIVLLIGKWFPTGAHKVGAAYGCLAPSIITGGFDPTYHKAVWPSTGNFCRGGAFDSILMGTEAIAILPELMSRERFEWLQNEAKATIIATRGSESNVKEIYDKCWELKHTRKDVVIFNQFDEFGNAAWHYNITGNAVEEVYNHLKTTSSKLTAYISATGSAGTIAAGDYLRTIHPFIKVVASEALQCPTMLRNGFGAHRIEGIGDKHIPWIHNVKNTDVLTAIDDEDTMRILRLFNEQEGIHYLKMENIDEHILNLIPLIGISGISNMLAAIKIAKYFEMTHDDFLFTIATDSSDMYHSRVDELRLERGSYSGLQAARDFEKCIQGQSTDNMKELGYKERQAIHNLKYFTWVEQQAKKVDDLEQLWYDRDIWFTMFNQVQRWDELIEEFNEKTGVLKGFK